MADAALHEALDGVRVSLRAAGRFARLASHEARTLLGEDRALEVQRACDAIREAAETLATSENAGVGRVLHEVEVARRYAPGEGEAEWAEAERQDERNWGCGRG